MDSGLKLAVTGLDTRLGHAWNGWESIPCKWAILILWHLCGVKNHTSTTLYVVMTSLKLAGYQTFLADRINIKFQWWANPNHDWDLNRDLNHFGNSIWDVKIWFKIIWSVVIWFENFVIWYGKIFKLREIAIILTHNGHFYGHSRTLYRCGKDGDHMEAVRQWLGTVVSEATVMIKSTSARLAACSKHVVSQSRPSTLQPADCWYNGTHFTLTLPPVSTSSLPVAGHAVVCSAL